MSLGAPDSEHHSVSELLYRAILLVWAWMMACDTEWRVFDKNMVEAVFYNCAIFILVSCVLCLVLRLFFITLVGVLDSSKLRGTTEHVLMYFKVLSLLTIYSNTGS